MSGVRITLAECERLCLKALQSRGLNEASAIAVAKNITGAERDGCKSHGLFRLPGYCSSLQSGKVNGLAIPQVRDVAPACVLVDAGGGLSTPATLAGHPLLVEKARANGIAVLLVARAFHFAALWPDVEPLAAQHGLVAFAFLNSKAFVAHWPGGNKPLYGTNPMAFACPRRGDGPADLSERPFVFDQASAMMARGDMTLAAQRGETISLGAALDPSGEPTSDPAAGLSGSQLPFGGHKGTALAIMIELLAASLTGDAFAFEAKASDNGDGGPTQHGEVIVAIDPERCSSGGRAAFLSRVETLLQHIQEEAAEAEAAGRSMRLPSERRFLTRTKTPSEGILVPEELYKTCLGLADAG